MLRSALLLRRPALSSRARACPGGLWGALRWALHSLCTHSGLALHSFCTRCAIAPHTLCTRSVFALHSLCTCSARAVLSLCNCSAREMRFKTSAVGQRRARCARGAQEYARRAGLQAARVFSTHQPGLCDDTYLWNDENSFRELFAMALRRRCQSCQRCGTRSRAGSLSALPGQRLTNQ